MLSNEEIQAMEILKACGIKCNGIDIYKILLNLIHRYSKEIEELKDMKKELTERVLRLESDKFWNNVVSKDKIKAKIEELEKDFKEYENGQEWEIQDEIRGQIDVLQSLLEKE